jgi:hypothetical protein
VTGSGPGAGSESPGCGIGRALISAGGRAGSWRGSGFTGAPGSAGGVVRGSKRGTGGLPGAWMELPHDGQGPVTPAMVDGTDNLIPQYGQKKWIKSFAMGWSAN